MTPRPHEDGRYDGSDHPDGLKKIKKYAKAVHANGGIVICSLTLSAPWILTKLEPNCARFL